MLYIHPEECIDCGACVPACPVAAIYESIDATPSHQKDLIEANASTATAIPTRWRKAEEIVKAHVAVAPRPHGGAGGGAPGAHARQTIRELQIADRGLLIGLIAASQVARSASCNAIESATADTLTACSEDRHLERQRHPGASGAGPGMDRARAPGRRLPAGNQSRIRSGARRPLRDGGLLVLLARRQGLFRRRPARQQDCRARTAASSPIPRSTTSTASSTVDDRRASTVASVYVPNGGKDFPAKMRFLEAHGRTTPQSLQAAGRTLVMLRRSERRAHRARRAPEGAQAARDRTAARGAGAARADHRPRPGRRRPRARSRQRRPVHLVGAVAEHAPAQHRLAARLRARQRGAGARARVVPGAEGRRHERPRAGVASATFG